MNSTKRPKLNLNRETLHRVTGGLPKTTGSDRPLTCPCVVTITGRTYACCWSDEPGCTL